jgi:hypothetical protein
MHSVDGCFSASWLFTTVFNCTAFDSLMVSLDTLQYAELV